MATVYSLPPRRSNRLLHVYSAISPTKKIAVNRECLSFRSTLSHRVSSTLNSWSIPVLRGEEFEFELHFRGEEIEVLSSRYIKINGLLAKEAKVSSGSVIEVGSTRFELGERETEEKAQSACFKKAKRCFQLGRNILIEGQTGIGKTRLAKKIAQNLNLSFYEINLSSFNENLVESEIFGYKKGAFTGAVHDQEGAIARARDGVLFLDEIDSISKSLQVKLLKFLDDKHFFCVGGREPKRSGAKVIFASGQKTQDLVKKNLMREDFFFRISQGHVITLKNLSSDVQKIEDFCLSFEKRHQVTLCQKLIQFYKGCPWPGNYRQLEGHLMRKMIGSEGPYLKWERIDDELSFSHRYLVDRDDQFDVEFRNFSELKEDYIRYAYHRLGSSVAKTAKILKLSPTTVRSYTEKKSRNNGKVHKMVK